ncbi:MAG: TerB family tellurite resistance protein [Pseudomonadota bacterium]
MLNKLTQFFTEHLERAQPSGAQDEPADSEHHFRLAVAALLVEVMRADFEEAAVERTEFLALVRDTFELDANEAEELLTLSTDAVDHSVSLYEFTRLINDHLPPERKREVVSLLWALAYADGELDKYEDHVIRKVADLIHVPHREFVQTRLLAEKDAKRRSSSSDET